MCVCVCVCVCVYEGRGAGGGGSIKIVLFSSEKGSILKGKTLLLSFQSTSFSPWKLFLPFRVDPFSEGDWCAENQTGSHKCCLPYQNWQTIYQVYQVP